MTQVLQIKNVKNILQKTERNRHGLKSRTLIMTVKNYCAIIKE